MIELLIVACLGVVECREVPLVYDVRQMSMISCMANGQHAVASWHNRNPAWTVKRWSCGHYSTRAAET